MSNSFLSSMTFANGSATRDFACDCDECGINVVPASIVAAIRQHKRQKLENGTLKRTQERRMIRRDAHSGVALWNWTLPRGAEPLVEFGTSHRLVWLQRWPGGNDDKTRLQSIGKGIIGSSDEEKTRKTLDWKEGGVYLIASNGGKAVGWIHGDSNTASSSSMPQDESSGANAAKECPSQMGHIVLQVVKVPLATVTQASTATSTPGDSPQSSQATWVFKILQLCRKGLDSLSQKEGKHLHYEFSSEDCEELKTAFGDKEQNVGDNAVTPVPVLTPWKTEK